jgi:hypothetical protein
VRLPLSRPRYDKSRAEKPSPVPTLTTPADEGAALAKSERVAHHVQFRSASAAALSAAAPFPPVRIPTTEEHT